jgi:putative phosphoribosyl transferase
MESVSITDGLVHLPGELSIPRVCNGLVIFAHGSGSSRFSPRNRQVADVLNQAKLGTLLFDLLTAEESEDRANVFDIPLLADRLMLATRWAQALVRRRLGYKLPVGFFGASTGAGAALWAAASLRDEVSAVVSRGGRPDLALSRLNRVTSPTLLIVGEYDEPVIGMNREALELLSYGELVIVPRATHLFEEPGALEAVARHAVAWFSRYFREELQRVA